MNQLKKWYVAWVWLGTKTGKGIAENGDYEGRHRSNMREDWKRDSRNGILQFPL